MATAVEAKNEFIHVFFLFFSRFGIDLSPYPNIVRIDNELRNHPAFVAAHPLNQPDTPPEEKIAKTGDALTGDKSQR